MKIRTGWISAALLMIAACAAVPGTDRPVPLSAGYIERENTAREPWDRCGPEFIQLNLPSPFVSILGPVLDGPFGPVCQRHDACYRLQEESQTWCDARMRTEMVEICNADRPEGSAAAALCRMRAHLYHGMVDNAFGAYAYEGLAGGRIAAVEAADAAPGEIQLCVTAENNTKLLQEFVVELRAVDGKRVDRAPRFREKAVRAGATEVMCVGTENSSYWTRAKLSGPLEVHLIVDRPDSLAFSNDMVIVDQRTVELPD